jgi:hypothetical protein
MNTWAELHQAYGVTCEAALAQCFLSGKGTRDSITVDLAGNKHLTFTRHQDARKSLPEFVVLDSGQRLATEFLLSRVAQYFWLLDLGIKFTPPRRKPYGSGNYGNGNV